MGTVHPFKDSFSLGLALTDLARLSASLPLGLCTSWVLHGLGELDSGTYAYIASF